MYRPRLPSAFSMLPACFLATGAIHSQSDSTPETVTYYVDFDAPIDGDGTAASPWNTLATRTSVPADGASEITIMATGFADPSELPEVITPGDSVEALRLVSWHLHDDQAPPAHLSRSFRLSEHAPMQSGTNLHTYTLPMGEHVPVAAVRGWSSPLVQPIPFDGLPDGVAFDHSIAAGFRAQQPDVVVPRASTHAELLTMETGWYAAPGATEILVKTPGPHPPGHGDEPDWHIPVHRKETFLSMNNFGAGNAARLVEIAGITFSFVLSQVDEAGDSVSRARTIEINPALSATISDNVFIHCVSEDNIACVNGGGPGSHLVVERNQYLGTGRDGGAFVASTQSATTYESLALRDNVVHIGFRLNTIDGEPTPFGTYLPAGALGTFHGKKVDRVELKRSIALSYNGQAAAPFQFPGRSTGGDARDPASYPVRVDDIYVDRGREMFGFHMNAVHVTRSFLRIEGNGLVRELAPSLWESCIFDLKTRYNFIGNIGRHNAAFSHCLFLLDGRPRTALFGVTEPLDQGSVFLRGAVFQNIGETQSVRFTGGYLNYAMPPEKPGALVGWSGSTQLGAAWFGPRTLDSGDPDTLYTPESGQSAGTIDAFRELYGQGVRLMPTGLENARPDADSAELESLLALDLLFPWAGHPTGPEGINAVAYSGRVGPFQGGPAVACEVADLTNPNAQLDMFDVIMFLEQSALSGGFPIDPAEFLGAFYAGCFAE